MTSAAYQVRTPSFEGPLPLLLSLIEKRKLFINEISLADVTDDYLTYVKKLEEFPFSGIANFIIVAATLILIKSRSLLPEFSLTEEEAGDIKGLESRLNLYRLIRDASARLKESLLGPMIWERPYIRNVRVVFSPDPSFTADNIRAAIGSVLESIPAKETLPEASVKKIVSIEEMIGRITERLQKEMSMSFSKFSGHTGTKQAPDKKVMVIVGFLALLELIKQGLVMVEQKTHFEDISIKAN